MVVSPAVTFVTPFVIEHVSMLPLVVKSVAAQTVPCAHVLVFDRYRRGAGYARNVGLARVASPFVVFLDADDTVAPDFAERTLAAWDGRYVYTDWMQNDAIVHAPCRAWVNETWHCITALVPTVWALDVGGFDTSLSGAEDTDFWLKLVVSGRCGKRLAEPLFHYSPHGVRSIAFHNSAEYNTVVETINQRYGGRIVACDGCPQNSSTITGKMDGDVLAQVQWFGNRRSRSRVPGVDRIYERASYPELIWVHPDELIYAPEDYKLMPETPYPPTPSVNAASEFGAFMAAAIQSEVFEINARSPVETQIEVELPPQLVSYIMKITGAAGTARTAPNTGSSFTAESAVVEPSESIEVTQADDIAEPAAPVEASKAEPVHKPTPPTSANKRKKRGGA